MYTKALTFPTTVTSWDEAIPLGNGDIGCLIWDSPEKLRFSLDKCDIWDCSDSPENQENFTYSDVQNLVKHRKKKKIHEKYESCYHKPLPTKLPTDKLILDLGLAGNVVSHLDFLTAEATLTIGETKLWAFIHAKEAFGMVKINKQNVQFYVENPAFATLEAEKNTKKEEGITQSLKSIYYPLAERKTETENGIEFSYFVQQTCDSFYGVMAAKKEENGETLLCYTVSFEDTADFVKRDKALLKSALENGYETAFEAHKAWWESYWAKSSISIDDELLEQQWYLNNYLLASCSRKGHYPMPLQGVWTADNGDVPPWKGDYHNDLNTQMSYTSYLKANHLPEGECFIDYLLSLTDRAKEFAHNFYGAKGLCLPSIMDIKGYCLGGWVQYSTQPTNQLWLCQIMARYYYFTKDETYLPKIYAYLEETGEFLLSILEEKNGFYKLPLSASPEMHDNHFSAWMKPNTNYDLSLMRAFCEDMIALSREMGKDDAVKKWQRVLGKLEPLAVNRKKQLMLSPKESLKGSHRHHAHCMAIYPLRTLEYSTEENKAIIDASVKQLEKYGKKYWTGYSMGWMAEFYIAQGQGEKAAQELHDFYNITCSQNGFHLNGDYKKICRQMQLKYRPFTLEGNFLAIDAMQDMLLYSEKEKLYLFPAIPKAWKKAEFKTFRAWGGLLVSAKYAQGAIQEVTITATKDTSFTLLNDLSHLENNKHLDASQKITMQAGETLYFTKA